MVQRLRIFISSPGDVQEERLRAHLVVQKLARDYARFFQIEAYLWEHEPMLASGHFQDAIELPSASDIMVLIVYSRLGTALPERTANREYRGGDGRAPVTGTEWEFEEALEANRARGAPDLLAYRKLGDPGASLADATKRAEQQRQWDALQAFWHRHFETGTIFLAGSAKFETLEDFDQKLEADLIKLIERRIEQGLAGTSGPPPAIWLKGSPFRGLTAYDFSDASIFFGQDAALRKGLTRLQSASENGCAFLLLLGPSGSGKSSLARAGLLPALFAPKAIPGVAIWRRVIMRAGQDHDPVAALARALGSHDNTGEVGLPELAASPEQLGELEKYLAAAADNPSYLFQQTLSRIAAEARASKGLLPHETARLVLLVDQLEELFTGTIAPERRELFIRILAGLARSGHVWVVATMRNDFWHRAVELPQLVASVEAGARLDLMSADATQVMEIVRRSAAAAGLTFEVDSESGVGLDAVIARAAADQAGALPLLSVMLEALYQRDVAAQAGTGAHALRFASYRQMGELRGAIARRADEVLESLRTCDPEAADSLPGLLRALVGTSAQGDGVTSRAAPLAAFSAGGPEARLIAAMLAEDARLLVASMTDRGPELRLAHESLITHWPRAREQVDRDRRDLETRSRLEALHRRWSEAAEAGERHASLLSGLNLAEGLDLVRRWKIDTAAGLGRFVMDSENQQRRSRRRAAMAAILLIGLFGALAGLATLQWRRAEQAAVAALTAQNIEADARRVADQERAHAVQSETRAQAALQASLRDTAQTLSSQAQIALGRHDVRNALALAVKAATIEKPILRADDVASSEAVLLQGAGAARQVVHISNARQRWWMPYAFVDDSTLAYAEAGAGLVLVDLRNGPRIISRTPLPLREPALHLAVARSRGLIAVALSGEVDLFQANAGSVRARIPFTARINGIDIDPAGSRLAVAAGAAIALVDLAHSNAVKTIPLPDGAPDAMVGQVRFASGDLLFVTAGSRVLQYDCKEGKFNDAVGELSGAGIGADRKTLDAVLADGKVPFVKLVPDIRSGARFFTLAPLELRSYDASAKQSEALPSGEPEFEFRGISAIDQERRGAPSTMATVLTRNRDDRLELQARYLSGDDGVLRASNGNLMPPFAELTVSAADVGQQKLDNCQISPSASHIACQYWSQEKQGIVDWALLGGDYPFQRILGRYDVSSALQISEDNFLVSGGKKLIDLTRATETVLGDLPDDWRLISRTADFIVALSFTARQVRIFRLTGEHDLKEIIPPVEGTGAVILPGADVAVIRDPGQVRAVDLTHGASLWTAPLSDVRSIAPKGDQELVAIAAGAAYVLDRDSGRIVRSYPLSLAAKAAMALDPRGRQLAFCDEQKQPVLLDLETGSRRPVTGITSTPTFFAWSRGPDLLLIGSEDGSVAAWRGPNDRAWLIPSMFDRNFKAPAWPGQPAQGVVLEIAVSEGSKRIAVVRQDMSEVDIYSLEGGRFLTRLTPPWSTLKTPAHVSFGPTGDIMTNWAVHPMTREQPRYVTVHRLPQTFDDAVAEATARLASLNSVWSPEGPAP